MVAPTPSSALFSFAPKLETGCSKLRAEAVNMEAAANGMAVSIFRPRFVVGPGRLGVLAVLFGWIRRNLPIVIPGNGTNPYMMVGVNDLSSACLLAVQKKATGIYNIGTEPTPSLGEIIEAVKLHAGSTSQIIPLPAGLLKGGFRALNKLGLSPLWPEQYEIADLHYLLDLSKIERELAWRAETPVIDLNIQAYDAYALRTA